MRNRRLLVFVLLLGMTVGIAGFVVLSSVAKRRAESISCANMVTSIALAALLCAEESGGVCPNDFASMSNELIIPKVLVCVGDHERQEAADWSSFMPKHCSYEILAPGLAVQHTNTAFFRCKIHGHLGYTDGTVFDGVRRRHKYE